MGSSSPTDAESPTPIHHQEAVADLSQQALETDDLDRLLDDVTATVAETLDAEYCAVLEPVADGTESAIRAGVGWPADLAGTTIPTTRASQTGHTLRAEDPVVVDDLRAEPRFADSPLLADHDVASAISVVVGSVDDPWGVLVVCTAAPREFTDADAAFVDRIADVLFAAVENERERNELERARDRQERRFEAVFEDPNILVGLLEPDGTVLDINGTAMAYVDADLEDVTGEPFWETPWWGVGEDVRADVERWTERAARGEYVEFEVDLTRSNGERYTLEGYVRPVTNDEGDVVSVIVSDRDVTERTAHERKLEESERRYRTLLDHFPDGAVALVDDTLTYRTVGGSPTSTAGATVEEIEGSPVGDVVRPKLAAELVPRYEAALEGASSEFELELDDRIYQFRTVPVRDDDGAAFAAFGMSQDITERTRRERELRDAKAQLEAATEAGAVGTWEWHVRDDRMVAGATFAETFGVDPDAAREGVSVERFLDSIHEDDRERVERRIDAALESCGEYEAEYRVRNADDEIRWIVSRGRVECDEDGEPVRFPGAVTDITERKRAELRLERNNEQLETLFDILPVGVVVADRDGEILQANDTAREIWGGDVFDTESVAEYEKYPVRWADSGEPVDPERMTLARVLDGEAVTDPDVFEIEAADGERRIVRVEGMPIRNERGEVTRGVTTLTDITDRREYQRKLAESERRYRTLIDHFPNGAVGLFDENFEYQIAGGSAFDEIGDTKEAVVGKTLWERYPDDLAARMEPKFRGALEGETSVFEMEFHDRDWIAYTVPVTDDDGEIFGGMILVQEITDRKERERELRERERHLERYETIVEVVNDGVYVVDEDGRFTMVNQAYAEMLDYPPDELVGTDASRIVDDAVIERVRELEAASEAGDVDWPTIEAEVETAGGDTRPTEATFSLLPESDDSDWHRVGVVRDISERKVRERQLAESERRYRTLIDHFPGGAVGLYDENLEYIVAGGEAFDDLGVPEETVVGSTLADRYPADLVDEVEPYFRAALEGESNTFEYRAHGQDVWAHTLPVRDDDGEIFAGMVMAQDVTERKEYQRKLEESNERLEQFAYAASHDLQEPLRMITSYLTLLEKRYGDAFDEDGEEFLEFAIDGADRMRAMIDGLLAYSRVETRGDPLEPVDLDDVLDAVLEDLQIQIEETNAEITVEELPRVEGDASQLRQLFQNLLSNAITYSGDAPPRVHVGAERRTDEWVLSVADDGIGIDPEDQDRVFSIFDRLHSREEYDGTGIGLALCERIVERHGGEIRVDSEPGEGATFSVALPAPRGE